MSKSLNIAIFLDLIIIALFSILVLGIYLAGNLY